MKINNLVNYIKELDDKKKGTLVVLSVFVLILLVVGGTVAFFGWQANEATVSLTVSSGTGSCEQISDNEKFLAPTASRENNGRIIKLRANQKMSNKAFVSWNMVINEIVNLQEESFKYELINSTTGKSYGSGNFKDITSNEGSNTIVFSNDEEKLDYNTDYEFTLYLWIDGSFNNPLTMADQEFDFDISCSMIGTEAGNSGSSSGTFISDLYSNASKSTVQNNGITYNYATDVSLMNDRLGNKDVGADDGNIRYYGADPNNYIYFNCETYPETNCETWRIIGLFKDIEMADGSTQDLIKIARASTLGNYSWDYTSTGSYDNNWHDATLNTLLNQTYYNSGTTTYYNNSKTGTSVSFASNGIKNDTTRNMIAEVVWNLGGWNTSRGVYSNKLYEYERGTAKCSSCTYDTTWPGKIALMYPSDYGYATDLSVCDKDIYNYDTSANCKDKDWLLKSGTTNSTQWLLTPNSGSVYYAWFVYSGGYVDHGYSFYIASGVRPVLFLSSELVIESEHEGTNIDPYRISLS